jgi:hypothetical protein
MNADQPMTEKEFNSILNRLQNLEDERDKLIDEIDNILDRLYQNRKPTVQPKPDSQMLATTPSASGVIPTLRTRIKEMDFANERLKAISNRLNELV